MRSHTFTTVARMLGLFAVTYVLAASAVALSANEPIRIESRLLHLRNEMVREWSAFPQMPGGTRLEVGFSAAKNPGEYALRLRQQDVKQAWRVMLNGKRLGDLVRDEADLVTYLPVPAGALNEGKNTLLIECAARGPQNSDDIRVGEVKIEPRSVREALSEGSLEIEVFDADSKQPLPCRVTLVDANGSLHPTTAASSDQMAVRPGVIYSSVGKVRCGVPAGNYTVFAGRGFEYSLARADVKVASGKTSSQTLMIRREVGTPGYVACDTHIHTLTFSGHGDATIEERLITLAGEGIELPIATDHNAHIDYDSHARRLGVRSHFTPVVGNEFTTAVGHFNVFPVYAGARVPDAKLREWPPIFDEIFGTPGAKVAILNHARDLHAGTRPFGPRHFNAVAGEFLDGRPLRFNGMEVLNSGATQTDVLRLFRDWMGLLNRGYQISPVGSSDSHDVSRFIVGQGRTYIRCDDRDVSQLDVGAAVDSFLAGRVLVSYGLLAELTVGGKYRSGDLAALVGNETQVDVRVLGPHWVRAERVQLYANGELIREEKFTLDRETPPVIKWNGGWKVPRPRHDLHLVAIALGPGIDGPYWPTAKPYQATSPDWTPHVVGCSGAIWLDGDGDGRRTAPRDYAERLFAASQGDLPKLVAALAEYDAAIAAQAAHLYRVGGGSMSNDTFTSAMKLARPQVAAGFGSYLAAWRENQEAAAP